MKVFIIKPLKILILIFSFHIIGCSEYTKQDCNYITDYYPYTAKAELEFYSKNYNEAYTYYNKAFKSCSSIKIGIHNDTQNFATTCLALGKNDLAFDYILKTFDQGGTLSTFLNDSIFNSVFDSEKRKQLLTQYDKRRTNYLSGINLDLRAELQKMITLDIQLTGSSRDSIFKVNELRLVQIFEEYGYPNEQMIGNYGLDQMMADPNLLLLHSSDSLRIHYFIPKIEEFVKHGKCEPLLLGMLYDNLSLFNNRPQTYGTYQSSEGGYANMIPDTSIVNKNRAAIGLPSLAIAEKIIKLKLQ